MQPSSRVDFRKKSMKIASSIAGTGTVAHELRCYKHSARVARLEDMSQSQRMIYESGAWQKTFDSMGALKSLNLKECVPFTTLNKAPYHCSALGHEYKVSYGTISHVEGSSARGASKTKEVKLSVCNCIDSGTIPRLKESNIARVILRCSGKTGYIQDKSYVPKSSVLVWWDGRVHNVEKICEWLMSFGLYLFTVRKGNTTLLVCFENISSSYRAVNCQQANSGIMIRWCDARLCNNGYYRLFQNYTVSKDAAWLKSFNRVVRPLSSRTKANEHQKRLQDGPKTVTF